MSGTKTKVEVRAKNERGRRRGGRYWPPRPTVALVSSEQLEAILSDDVLVVKDVSPDTPVTPKTPKKAAKKEPRKARKTGRPLEKEVVTTTPDPGDEDLERTPLTGDNGGR